MASAQREAIDKAFGEHFPSILSRMNEGEDTDKAVSSAWGALKNGGLSWARLNQTLHRCSEAGMSEGFFQYYFLQEPPLHPYPVICVLPGFQLALGDGVNEITSVAQLQWGLRRFVYDAMLFWGNFRQAYRDLRRLNNGQIEELFLARRRNQQQMIRRGKVQEPIDISRDHRYLISEMACKTYENASSPAETRHVQLACEAFRSLRADGREVTAETLKEKTKALAEGYGQINLFDLMYETGDSCIESEDAVVALYSGQWRAFQKARSDAIENTRIYLSSCNDLDVYVATSMRSRQDFRDMAATCEKIFNSPILAEYNLRYFDPTLSAAQHHEDKGLLECLMVRTAKVLIYFAQHKESLGKVSEYAMALSLGKPVIVLCPDDVKGRERYQFYRDAHPLLRLVEFESGIVNGAMVTYQVDDAVELLHRLFSNSMEYDLSRKSSTDAYYILRERLTGSTMRIVTDDKLLTETFWNNWHGID